MSSSLDKIKDAITMPAKNVNDFRYHRLERDSQYTDLQVNTFILNFIKCIIYSTQIQQIVPSLSSSIRMRQFR
jgi:hypothetical protein